MCSNFFQTEQISHSLAALDEALALAGCPAVHRTKWSYWFSIWILGSEVQKSRSGFRISTSNIPCEPIFSQNGQLWIFWPKFGEIAQLRVIFWFEYCWGCCRELGGDSNELVGGAWSWVEVEMSSVEVIELDGGGCTVQ